MAEKSSLVVRMNFVCVMARQCFRGAEVREVLMGAGTAPISILLSQLRTYIRNWGRV